MCVLHGAELSHSLVDQIGLALVAGLAFLGAGTSAHALPAI